MNVFRISTNSWDEEDFYVLTTLDPEQIRKVIEPMVKYERENEIMYDNEDYVLCLQQRYKRAKVVIHQYIELIQF
jgi:hypothetical protein